VSDVDVWRNAVPTTKGKRNSQQNKKIVVGVAGCVCRRRLPSLTVSAAPRPTVETAAMAQQVIANAQQIVQQASVVGAKFGQSTPRHAP